MNRKTSNEPEMMLGFAAHCVRPASLAQFLPDRIHLLSSFSAHRNTVVDIACKERPVESYAGDDKARQTIELKFGDFVDFYQASFAGRPHWLLDVDDLDFYLCQCPVAVFKPDATCSAPTLPSVMDDFVIPECLRDQPLSQVNLWMSTRAGRTGLHYDAYQNVLVVLFGQKVVTMYPPSETARLYPFPVHLKSANHSNVSVDHPDMTRHPKFAQAKAQRFVVGAGDALFIPEGWWHQVDSDPYTIAANYWWEGTRVQLTKDPGMTAYYARVMMEELIEQQTDTFIEDLRSASQASPQCASLPLDAIDEIVRIFCDTHNREEREKMVLSLEPLTTLGAFQTVLAKEHQAEWRALLRDSSMELAAILAACWDQTVDDAEFQSTIFSALGGEEESIKLSLVAKREQFQRKMCATVCQSVLGIEKDCL